MTSVMAVEVAPDLKTCKAYISVLGNDEAKKATIAGLKKRRRLYQTPACKESESQEHTGNPFYPG